MKLQVKLFIPTVLKRLGRDSFKNLCLKSLELLYGYLKLLWEPYCGPSLQHYIEPISNIALFDDIAFLLHLLIVKPTENSFEIIFRQFKFFEEVYLWKIFIQNFLFHYISLVSLFTKDEHDSFHLRQLFISRPGSQCLLSLISAIHSVVI